MRLIFWTCVVAGIAGVVLLGQPGDGQCAVCNSWPCLSRGQCSSGCVCVYPDGEIEGFCAEVR